MLQELPTKLHVGDELLSNGGDGSGRRRRKGEGHMVDSECTPLHNLELAFIFWEKDQQHWIWHRAASTKKSQVGPQSKCKGPKPRHKCKGEISTHLHASQLEGREKIIDTLKIERF